MEENKKVKLLDRLRVTFRMVLLNDETFEELGSYKLTPLNVYIAISSILVAFAIIVTLLIVYTPLKRYIPGYGGAYATSQIESLSNKVSKMEKELKAYKTYTENIKKAITGDVENESDVSSSSNSKVTVEKVERVKEDEMLRKEIEREEKLGTKVSKEEEEGAVNMPTTASSGSPSQSHSKNTPLEMMIFTAPLKGELSLSFKPDIDHFGVDIVAPKNTPIKACMDGYVLSSDWTLDAGNTIIIQHANNVVSVYKHNSELLKKAGSFVKTGEAIAIIGNTGKLTNGPHLHFELWYNGKPVDPKTYINL
ncbi:MAG: M23 family metallopeptidase [Saprospiraceae bacterium]|nr:M23 family metallopeptidase [Saprospiraceae bacterium]